LREFLTSVTSEMVAMAANVGSLLQGLASSLTRTGLEVAKTPMSSTDSGGGRKAGTTVSHLPATRPRLA